jgi:Flp pilus assembly protein TadB
MNETPVVTFTILSVGAGYTVASLTPGVAGPGWIAFAVTMLAASVIWDRMSRRRSRR